MTNRAPAGTPDGGSMPLAMLITVVGVLLSGVLATTLTGQMASTRNAVQSQRALEAAQTGLDIALGQIRLANDGTDTNGEDDNGVLAKLPCGPLIGRVGGTGTASYTVTLTYTSIKGGTPIPCHGSKGPAFIQLESVGVDQRVVRTLRGLYAVRTTSENIPGGLLRVYKTATSRDLCLHASGLNVVVQPCTPGNQAQQFGYYPNLTIVLVSSITDSMPLGRCVDAGPVPHTVDNAAATLQPCASTTQPRQQWSFNDNGNFEGTKADGSGTDGTCLNIQFPDQPGSRVVLKTSGGCGQAYTNVQNFNPDPDVGAGAAGRKSGQLVNYKQFGRCIDVPGRDWLRGYLSAWPCKQQPDPAQITWNQKWQLPTFAAGASSATGSISTQPDYTAFRTCITSPLTTGSTAYAYLSQCLAALPLAARWTVNGDTGDPQTSFTIVDNAGKCLTAADPDDPTTVFHTSGNKISRIIMLPCTGSPFQKWNADPYVLRPKPLTELSEQ